MLAAWSEPSCETSRSASPTMKTARLAIAGRLAAACTNARIVAMWRPSVPGGAAQSPSASIRSAIVSARSAATSACDGSPSLSRGRGKYQWRSGCTTRSE